MMHYSHYIYIYIHQIVSFYSPVIRMSYGSCPWGTHGFFSGLGRHCDQLGAESQVIFTWSMISLVNIETAMENHNF